MDKKKGFEYRFLDSNLNRQESKLNYIISSDINFNNHKYLLPRFHKIDKNNQNYFGSIQSLKSVNFSEGIN